MNKWMDLLPQETALKVDHLLSRVKQERKAGKVIYPSDDKILRALDVTAPEEVKVVIVGQDPYHSPGAANGLAFSIERHLPLQPSLRKIFQELVNDIKCAEPKNGDLTAWAERGVLLLNTTLTVYEHEANSHASWGWNTVTKDILKITAKLPQPIVYLLWGANAQSLRSAVIGSSAEIRPGAIFVSNETKKAAILSSHPSPLSATKMCGSTPAFVGSRPFSRANKLLIEMGGEPVDWRL